MPNHLSSYWFRTGKDGSRDLPRRSLVRWHPGGKTRALCICTTADHGYTEKQKGILRNQSMDQINMIA